MKHLVRELKSDETVEFVARMRYNAVVARIDAIFDTWENGEFSDGTDYREAFSTFTEYYMFGISPNLDDNMDRKFRPFHLPTPDDGPDAPYGFEPYYWPNGRLYQCVEYVRECADCCSINGPDGVGYCTCYMG